MHLDVAEYMVCMAPYDAGGSDLPCVHADTHTAHPILSTTGAARIAIGARAHGVDGITIVPLGIHYEDKAALRSRVLVNVGQPLELDELLGGDASDNSITPADHIAVANVTHQIDVALRRVAPDFEDWNEARLLAAGADIALRTQL